MNEPQIVIYNIKETILKFLNDDIGWQRVIYIRVYGFQIFLLFIYEKTMYVYSDNFFFFGKTNTHTREKEKNSNTKTHHNSTQKSW